MAAAAELTDKQLSNLLGRINLRVDQPGRQGRSRRVDVDTAQVIDLVALLSRLGVAATESLALVRRLRDAPASELELGPGLTLRYDRDVHRGDLDTRLRDAVERVVPRRRGRPPLHREAR